MHKGYKKNLILPKKCRFKITNKQHLLDFSRSQFESTEFKNIVDSYSNEIKELLTQTPLNAIFDKIVHLNGPCLAMKSNHKDGISLNQDNIIIHQRSFRKVHYRHDGFPIITNSSVIITILIDKDGCETVSAKVEESDNSCMIEFEIENDEGWEIV